MNLIHRGRVARFATVPQNTTTLRSPFPRGEGFFSFRMTQGVKLSAFVTPAFSPRR